jgi:hypothetical protein
MSSAVDPRLAQLRALLVNALERGDQEQVALVLHSIATESGQVESEI